MLGLGVGINKLTKNSLPNPMLKFGSIFGELPHKDNFPWTNHSYARYEDDLYAESLSTGGIHSAYLAITGFNFNIPSGASIDGVEMIMTRKCGLNSGYIYTILVLS